MKTSYDTMPTDFAAIFAPAYIERDEFTANLVRQYVRLGAAPYARSIEDWLDQLKPSQLRQLYALEQSTDEASANVLRLVCFQFAMMQGAGEGINLEVVETLHAAARQWIADKLGREL